MLRYTQHDENRECMAFLRHPEPFKGEGSSKVLPMKNDWMLRYAQHDGSRECMTRCGNTWSFSVILNECEGSSDVLQLMKNNWMLRYAQHDVSRQCMTRIESAWPFAVILTPQAYNAKGLPVEYNRKSEGWDWVFL